MLVILTISMKPCLYTIGGLSEEVNEELLYHAFITFGDIIEVIMPRLEGQDEIGKHRGFGFVEFESPDDAKAAIDNMHLSEIYGKVIKCSYAKEMALKDNSGRPLWLNEEYIQEFMKQYEEESLKEESKNVDQK